MVEIDNVFGDDDASQLARDRALRAVADTSRAETRSYDLSGRLGGDEFVVLLSGIGGKNIVAVADHIRAAVERHEVGTRGGHGLGLAIIRAVAEAHHGMATAAAEHAVNAWPYLTGAIWSAP